MTDLLIPEAGQSAPIRHYGASLSGEAFRALRVRFPGRKLPDAWAATAASRAQVLARLERPPLQSGSLSTRQARHTGADRLLRWLETFPGETWQQRWRASPADDRGADWVQDPVAWLADSGKSSRSTRAVLDVGLAILLCADVLRPDLEWLVSNLGGRCWRELVAAHRDPEGFAELTAKMDPALSQSACRKALAQITLLLIAKGGKVRDIQVGDCLELREAEARVLANGGRGRTRFYTHLRELGTFPADAPPSLARIGRFTGQSSVEGLVDRYALQCRPVRDLIVDYLAERQPALDYSSLDGLSRSLSLYFWKNLEDHHPGIDSIRLGPEVAAEWKARLRTKATRRRLPDGSTSETTSLREGYTKLLTNVRAFYLDIAQWALEDPARWGPWAVPCPISEAEISFKKTIARRKARMDQRTRERLPLLPSLVEAAARQLADARLRLDAARSANPGSTFTVCGQTFTKAGRTGAPGGDGSATAYDATFCELRRSLLSPRISGAVRAAQPPPRGCGGCAARTPTTNRKELFGDDQQHLGWARSRVPERRSGRYISRHIGEHALRLAPSAPGAAELPYGCPCDVPDHSARWVGRAAGAERLTIQRRSQPAEPQRRTPEQQPPQNQMTATTPEERTPWQATSKIAG